MYLLFDFPTALQQPWSQEKLPQVYWDPVRQRFFSRSRVFRDIAKQPYAAHKVCLRHVFMSCNLSLVLVLQNVIFECRIYSKFIESVGPLGILRTTSITCLISLYSYYQCIDLKFRNHSKSWSSGLNTHSNFRVDQKVCLEFFEHISLGFWSP